MKRHLQHIRDGEYSDEYFEDSYADGSIFDLDDYWEEEDYGDILPQKAVHRLNKQAAKNASRMKKAETNEDRDDF